MICFLRRPKRAGATILVALRYELDHRPESIGVALHGLTEIVQR